MKKKKSIIKEIIERRKKFNNYKLINEQEDEFEYESPVTIDDDIITINGEEFEFGIWDYDFSDLGNYPGSFSLWVVNKNTGICTPTAAPITDFYICPTAEDYYIQEDTGWLGGLEGLSFNLDSESGNCARPDVMNNPYENTLINFLEWINGQYQSNGLGPYIDGQLSALFDPNNNYNWYLSDECPACVPTTAMGEYDLFDETSLANGTGIYQGNNYNYIGGSEWENTPAQPNTVPNELTWVEDGSCTVSACPHEVWDNYFFNNYPNIEGDIIITNNGQCTYTGCNNIADANYICTDEPGLCPGSGAAGQNFFNGQYNGQADNPTPFQGIYGGYTSPDLYDTNGDGYNASTYGDYVDVYVNNEISLGNFIPNNDDCALPVVGGCTNPNFPMTGDIGGYDPNATFDNGSCQFVGCAHPQLQHLGVHVCTTNPSLCYQDTDSSAFNYASEITTLFMQTYEDGLNTGLYYDTVQGATVIDDGTTCPFQPGCTLVGMDNYSETYNYDDGSCQLSACTTNTSPNFICRSNPEFCTDIISGDNTSGTPITSYVGIQGETISAPNVIIGDETQCGNFGCTFPTNGNATDVAVWFMDNWNNSNLEGLQDGLTYSQQYGDINDDIVNYFIENPPGGTLGSEEDIIEDGSCNFDTTGDGIIDANSIEGCMSGPNSDGVSTTINYNPEATWQPSGEDNPCIPVVYGCTDGGNQNQDWWEGNATPLEGTQGSNTIFQDDGVTLIALNNMIDGVNYSINGGSYPPTYPSDLLDEATPAANYNENANIDDGSCEYNYNLPGCLHVGAPGYQPYYTEDISVLALGDLYDIENNPCGYTLGCTDENANNTLSNIDDYTLDNGSCTYDVLGCMEPAATNYMVPSNPQQADMTVNIEDGSCSFTGCVQPLATNQTKLGDIEGDNALALNSIYLTSQFNYGKLTNIDSIIGLTGQSIISGEFGISGDPICQFGGLCNNPAGDNYICGADSPNFGLCTWDGSSYIFNEALGDIINDDGFCTGDGFEGGVGLVPGCMDPYAENYDPAAETVGNTWCQYKYCPDDIFDGAVPWNVGATQPNGDFHPGGGDANTKPQYIAVNGDLVGGGIWNAFQEPTDIPDFSRCRFEGCGTIANGMSATDSQGNTITNDIPGQVYNPPFGVQVSDAVSVLYTHSEQNSGCEENGILDIDNISCCVIDDCIDPVADTYNEDATVQSTDTCEYNEGCTNPDADNFEYDAVVDDGSCVIEGCMDADGDNFNPDATQDTYDACLYIGCTDPNYLEYYLGGGVIEGLETLNDLQFDDGGYILTLPPIIANSIGEEQFEDLCINEIIEGCTQQFLGSVATINFNPLANVNDGSCEALNMGCMDSGFLSMDADFNYGQWMTNPDGGGYSETGPYLNNGGATNDSQIQDNAPGTPSLGSFMPGTPACNYQPGLNYDDGSCIYPLENEDCDGNSTLEEVPGCTYQNACNYNPDATEDDGSCYTVDNSTIMGNIVQSDIYLQSTDGDIGNQISSPNQWVNAGGAFCNGPLQTPVCLDAWDLGNYTPDCYLFACNIDDCPEWSETPPECWDITVEQCGPWPPCDEDNPPTQTLSCVTIEGGEPNTTQVIELPTDVVYGCTDDGALNFLPCATEDDGSCEYPTGPDFAFGCEYCPAQITRYYTGTWPSGFEVSTWPPPDGSPISAYGEEEVISGFWYPYDTSGVYDFSGYDPSPYPFITAFMQINPSNCRSQANAYGEPAFTNLANGAWAQFCGDNDQGNFTGNPGGDEIEYIHVPGGCTENSAHNYDPDAEYDDGSCLFACDPWGAISGNASGPVPAPLNNGFAPGAANGTYWCNMDVVPAECHSAQGLFSTNGNNCPYSQVNGGCYYDGGFQC